MHVNFQELENGIMGVKQDLSEIGTQFCQCQSQVAQAKFERGEQQKDGIIYFVGQNRIDAVRVVSQNYVYLFNLCYVLNRMDAVRVVWHLELCLVVQFKLFYQSQVLF
eukprot:TRINITY_DN4525_c0_g1_i15.p2 TRINITY_DN4525_c0_g1~~TRINITY_DN4525_c0_g1_i15.p2  ORF type:complete len:108 (-),score=3.38 TRINITY_DN4525_c0_g1_i15:189-512(-)